LNYKEAFHAAIDGAIVKPIEAEWELKFDNGCWKINNDSGYYDEDVIGGFIEYFPDTQWEIVSFTNKFNVGDFVTDIDECRYYRIKEVTYDHQVNKIVYTLNITTKTIGTKYENQLRGIDDSQA
jgi:hypothetical protein